MQIREPSGDGNALLWFLSFFSFTQEDRRGDDTEYSTRAVIKVKSHIKIKAGSSKHSVKTKFCWPYLIFTR